MTDLQGRQVLRCLSGNGEELGVVGLRNHLLSVVDRLRLLNLVDGLVLDVLLRTWVSDCLPNPVDVHLGEGHHLIRAGALGFGGINTLHHVVSVAGATGQGTAHISIARVSSSGTTAHRRLRIVSISAQSRTALVLAQLLHRHLLHDGTLQVNSEDIFAPSGGDAVLGSSTVFIFQADWSNVLIVSDSFVQVEESHVRIEVGGIVSWVNADLFNSNDLEGFGLIIDSQFPFSALDFQVSVVHTINAVSSSGDGILINQGTSAQKRLVRLHQDHGLPCVLSKSSVELASSSRNCILVSDSTGTAGTGDLIKSLGLLLKDDGVGAGLLDGSAQLGLSSDHCVLLSLEFLVSVAISVSISCWFVRSIVES